MSITKRFLGLVRPVIERFPSVAMTYRFIRDNKPLLNEPKQTPMGFNLTGNASMEQGSFEPEESRIVGRIVEKVDVVINIGANIGYYCCIALQKGRYVIAFEPVSSNLRYLYQNVRANHWEDKIEIFPIALSNRIGLIEIFGGGTSASLLKGWAGTPRQYVQWVPTSTLDNVLGVRFHGKNCFFIVDVEGAEKLMLDGASSSLSWEPKPIWMVEIAISEHQPKGVSINPQLLDTFQMFWERGYEARTADKRLHHVRPNEVESAFKSGKDCLFTHNFLFIESRRRDEILDDLTS